MSILYVTYGKFIHVKLTFTLNIGVMSINNDVININLAIKWCQRMSINKHIWLICWLYRLLKPNTAWKVSEYGVWLCKDQKTHILTIFEQWKTTEWGQELFQCYSGLFIEYSHISFISCWLGNSPTKQEMKGRNLQSWFHATKSFL